jgi:pSer/pThr/pTyr-binding forkhead associated (FHA) protein
MFCTKCGHNNPVSGIFCARCGERLGKSQPSGEATVGLPAIEEENEEEVEFTTPAAVLEKGSAMLVIKKGPDAGMSFTISRPVISIGRHPESDIFLDDITVSRRHAEIHRENGNFRLVDTGSLNGTYLNHERIESADLIDSDEIQIGKFRLLFLSGSG